MVPKQPLTLLRLPFFATRNRLFCSGKQGNAKANATSCTLERPKFVTSKSFQNNDFKNRFTRAMDSSSGVRPTETQKKCLILTRVFKTQAKIPEYVAPASIQRMRNRVRGIVILLTVFVFHTIYKIF
ncbi:hypothetical protein L596_015310 [Steinernema carpocapsae]|uniref:Uncharacterized protein n=1 Tax=Steinernema carpocapsae TaxID=34508 RepID=A0A4U5NFH1_STECR|nr:hypothetical protein L596_015310 [Steinernema carpocapsae]